MANLTKYRKDFTILQKPIIYFDNACMTLRPKPVVDKVVEYYNEYPACAGRSQHNLGMKAESEVDNARKICSKFLGAKKVNEIVFTKNATEGINLVCRSLGLKKGDSVLTTDKEHNSNLIPWQLNPNVKHKWVSSKEDNTFDMEAFEKMLTSDVKLVSMVHTSNLDGYTIPAKEIIKLAHDKGKLVMLDAAQSTPHQEINVKKLGVDFLACSGHKMLGPTGTGILYGKEELLNQLKPFIVGGETVSDSTYSSHTLEKAPHKFEAGLQNYAGIVGMGAALKYLSKVGLNNIHKHEIELNKHLTNELANEVEIIGPSAKQRGGIFNFNINGIDPHIVSLTLDKTAKIMTRSGRHCVHSWFNAKKIGGSARASLYLYNTKEECDKFVQEVRKISKHLK